MRLAIVGVIFLRELRDQLRDRRTIFMVVVLPLLLYPFLGMGAAQVALGFIEQPSTVGIVGQENLPPPRPIASTAWLSLTPSGPSLGIDRIAGVVAWGMVDLRFPSYPPLLVFDHLNEIYFDSEPEKRSIHVTFPTSFDASILESGQADIVMVVPPDFMAELDRDGRPNVVLHYRENGDRGRIAAARVYGILRNYKKHLREIRLVRKGLPPDFDDPIQIVDSVRDKLVGRIAAEGLLELLVRIFPFLLVMWSLAGALYPAVDVCAGEKERGTMETLLISPASREEIVWGKFLTIWLFSAASALLNLASMGITSALFGGILPTGALPKAAFLWCGLLALPLTALFSAICLSVGAYARSSKEGQYYLIPLFFITMPLVFLTLAPGVELNPLYSMVPITGVALLMQRLMTSSIDNIPWIYFVPVLAPMALYSWLALRWGIEQFRREEVLFREAERLDLQLWVKSMFREKESLPSAGQAVFCFAMILVLRWLFFTTNSDSSITVRTAIAYLAFVAAPPMFMALILTRHPRQSLGLMTPTTTALVTAGTLSAVLLPPLVGITRWMLLQFPAVKDLLRADSPVMVELLELTSQGGARWWPFLMVFGLMAAVCEEIAFRGFILTGLRGRLGNWTAMAVSSVLFAIYHLNVFQAVPSLILGMVLAMLTVWSRSILPAMLLHLLHNCLVLGPGLWMHMEAAGDASEIALWFHPVLNLIFGVVALGVLAVIGTQLSSRTLPNGSKAT